MNLATLRRLPPLLLAMTLLTMGLAAISVGAAPPAYAGLCSSIPEDGTWTNADSGTRSITKARIYCGDAGDPGCDDDDVCSSTSAVAWFVQLWGSCSPTDCNWGAQELTPDSGGWERASYDQGFATRAVWVRTENWYGRTYLRVSIWTDYRDSRTDKWTTDWFLR